MAVKKASTFTVLACQLGRDVEHTQGGASPTKGAGLASLIPEAAQEQKSYTMNTTSPAPKFHAPAPVIA